MSVYIKGMEMPTSCYKCNLKKIWEDGVQCLVNKGLWMDGDSKHKACPLIPVPDHGDLIDYDFCMRNYELLHDDDGNPVYAVKMRDINRAPTIIPSDKEGEG